MNFSFDACLFKYSDGDDVNTLINKLIKRPSTYEHYAKCKFISFVSQHYVDFLGSISKHLGRNILSSTNSSVQRVVHGILL